MKYIRTKDRIDLLRKGVDKYIVKDSDYSCEIAIDEETLLKNYKVADTIEELFMPDDLIIVIVGNEENKIPFLIENIKDIKRFSRDIYVIKEFYIKNGNDFKCVAKANKEERLELI